MHMTIDVPVYVWGIVAVLTLAWIKLLLPDSLFRRGSKNTTPSPYLEFDSYLKPGPASAATTKPAVAAPTPPAPPAQWTLEQVRALDAGTLEDVVCAFWRARNCTVEPHGDQLLISRPSTGRRFAIAQCQPAGPNKVSLDTVKAFWDAAQQQQAPLGLFYGLSGFSTEALAFAKEKHLKLLMGSDLLTEIGMLNADQQQALLSLVTPAKLAA